MTAMHRPPPPPAPRAFYSGRQLEAEPRLTAAEEAELATAARAGDAEARNRLVRGNLRLVLAIARDFRSRGLAMEDLVGEGNLGLIRAATEFDPRLGVRFGTYAGHWVRQAIRHALITTAAPIRLPAHMVTLLTRWRRAERALLRSTGVPPSSEELAAALGLGAARRRMVEQALRARRLAPEAGGAEAGGEPAGAAAGGAAPGAEVEAADARAELRRRLGRLAARERAILELRYGLGGGEPQTLKEIGHRLGVTREWVRRIELRALGKLVDDVPSPQIGPPSASSATATRARSRGGRRARRGAGPSPATGATGGGPSPARDIRRRPDAS